MTLTTMKQIKSLQPRDKKYNRGCGDGLYLTTESSKKGGNKYFYGEYRKQSCWIGKWGQNSCELSLIDAKNRWLKIKEWSIAHNKHPKDYKNKDNYNTSYTLRDAINDFLEEIELSVKQTTLKEYTYKLNTTVLTKIDERTNIIDLEWGDGCGRARINKVLDEICDNRKFELRERCRKLLKQTFELAIDRGHMKRGHNPAIKGARRQVGHKIIHHKSIDWADVPTLIADINFNRCNAEVNTILCTKFMLLTALRSGAATRLRWDMFKHILVDGDKCSIGIDCIVIPGTTPGLKRRRGTSEHIPHYLPITNEIKNLLRRIREINGESEYIFKAWRTKKYPHMNPEAPNKFLQNIGYKDKLVAHGCRSLFMTTAREKLKVEHRIIDLQLGHIPGNKVDAAYDRSQMLIERRQLLDDYNSLLVKAGLDV